MLLSPSGRPYRGVLLQACRVCRVTLRGGGALPAWPRGGLFSSEGAAGLAGAAGEGVSRGAGAAGGFPGAGAAQGLPGSGAPLAGAPSPGLGAGEDPRWGWRWAFLAVSGALALGSGFPGRGVPSSPFSKVTKEQ